MPYIPQRLLLFPARRRRKIKSRNITPVPTRFLRYINKEQMNPLTFRILCHGLSFKSGWSVNKCMIDTGYTRNVVYRHLSWLIDKGYVLRRTNRSTGRYYYRFRTTESLLL